MSLVWERRECVSAQVDDALVLLDLETLAYHSLNTTAAAIWELLAEPRDEAALVRGLCGRYAVDERTCSQSVQRLLGVLESSRLIRPKPALAA